MGGKSKPKQKQAPERTGSEDSEKASEEGKCDEDSQGSFSEEGEEDQEGSEEEYKNYDKSEHCQHHEPQRQKAHPQQAKNVQKHKQEILNTLLINIYNGKKPQEYIQNYSEIVQILDQERKNGVQLFEAVRLDAELEQRLDQIMDQVRKKLIDDGTNDELIEFDKENNTYRTKKRFCKDSKTLNSYNSIVQAVVEYFELFKKSANKLEFIILEMFSKLKLKPQNKKTFINAIHYKVYLFKVIEVQGIKEIIEEIRQNSKLLAENPDNELTSSIQTHLNQVDAIVQMARDAGNENSELRVDYGKFIQELREEERIKINDILDQYRQKKLEREQLKLDRSNGQASSSKKQKNRKKKAEGEEEAGQQQKRQKTSQQQEKNKYQQMDLDTLVSEIEQTGTQKQGGKKRNKKKKQQEQVEQAAADQPGEDPQPDAQFETQLEGFVSRLARESARAVKKVQPNVDKDWLGRLRQQIDRLNSA